MKGFVKHNLERKGSLVFQDRRAQERPADGTAASETPAKPAEVPAKEIPPAA